MGDVTNIHSVQNEVGIAVERRELLRRVVIAVSDFWPDVEGWRFQVTYEGKPPEGVVICKVDRHRGGRHYRYTMSWLAKDLAVTRDFSLQVHEQADRAVQNLQAQERTV